MPILWNMRRSKPPKDAIYIGRGSPWGNKYVIGIDGTRQEVIEKHKKDLLSNPTMIARVKIELKGKDLVCFCTPLPCHGDTLIEIANE